MLLLLANIRCDKRWKSNAVQQALEPSENSFLLFLTSLIKRLVQLIVLFNSTSYINIVICEYETHDIKTRATAIESAPNRLRCPFWGIGAKKRILTDFILLSLNAWAWAIMCKLDWINKGGHFWREVLDHNSLVPSEMLMLWTLEAWSARGKCYTISYSSCCHDLKLLKFWEK